MAVKFQSTLPARGATARNRGVFWWPKRFNPRSPRGERHNKQIASGTPAPFQSTLPARGATPCLRLRSPSTRGFNPRSPRGERQRPEELLIEAYGFNPRSPRGERPSMRPTFVTITASFQSTLPARGATAAMQSGSSLDPCFNPRSPRGERRRVRSPPAGYEGFQSTLPARGATR